MTELYEEFFSLLRLVKSLHDCGLADPIQDYFGSWVLDEDSYWEITYESIRWIFQWTSHYYNDQNEVETWLFTDPAIDQFCRLCLEYEKRKAVAEQDNPYRRDAETMIRQGFEFNSYSYNYDWRLSPRDRGRKCLLLFTGCEFYSYDEVPEGLAMIRDGFLYLNQRLEAELEKAETMTVLPVTETQRKEAA